VHNGVKAEAGLPHSRNRAARRGRQFGLGKVEFDVVDEAPTPVFTGFERTHDGMLGAMEVLGGVLVFGGVAASDVAALHAQTKMHPGVAHFQALFAALGVWRNFVNVAQMRASAHDLATPI
jgi:hypothetical protein